MPVGSTDSQGVYSPAFGEELEAGVEGWKPGVNANFALLSKLLAAAHIIPDLDPTGVTSSTVAMQAFLDGLDTLTSDVGPTTLATVLPGTYSFDRPVRIYRKALRILGNDTIFRWTGPTYKSISTATHSGTTVTITTSTAHGFTTGDRVTVADITESSALTVSTKYNGAFVITVTGASTFTYVTNSAAPSVDGDAATGICGYSMFIMEDSIVSGFDNIYFQGNTTTPPIDLLFYNSAGGTLGTNGLSKLNDCQFGSWFWSSPTTFSAVAILETARNGVRYGGIGANGDKFKFRNCVFGDLVNGVVCDTTQNVWGNLENPYFNHISNDGIKTASSMLITNPSFAETRGWEIEILSTARVTVHKWNSEGSRGYAKGVDTAGGAFLTVHGGKLLPNSSFGSGYSFDFVLGSTGGLLLDGVQLDNSQKATPDIHVRGVNGATTPAMVTLRDCTNFLITDLDIVAGTGTDNVGGIWVRAKSRDMDMNVHLTNSQTLDTTIVKTEIPVGNFVVGHSTVVAAATSGFAYLPSGAHATGTPNTEGTSVPLKWCTDHHCLMAYENGTWRHATFAQRVAGYTITNGGGASSAATSSQDTVSISPTTGRLILGTITSQVTSGVPADATVTGLGLTWVEIAHCADYGAVKKRTTLVRAMGTVTPGVVNIDFGASQQHVNWQFVEFDGVLTTGSNGADAIVQSATNTAASGTSLTVTLSAFADSANGTFGGFGFGGLQTVSAGSGFTAFSQQQNTTESSTTTRCAEWRPDSDTTVDMTYTTTAASGGVAVELAAGT